MLNKILISQITILSIAFTGPLFSSGDTHPQHPFHGIHSPQKSVIKAKLGLFKRQNNLIKSYIRNQAYLGSFEDWETDGKAALRKMASGLFAFSHPHRFNRRDFSILSGLPASQPFHNHLAAYQNKLLDYLQTIHIFADVGTGGIPGRELADYDFLLNEAVPVLFGNIRNPKVLTNEMTWLLLIQGEDSPQTVPFSGQNVLERLTHRWAMPVAPYVTLKVSQPETENHVLMIFAWQYLVNNYVCWAAGLSPKHPRFDSRIKALYNANPAHYQNSEVLIDFMLQILGRIVHNGLFETNAKPYEAFSIGALLNIYTYATSFSKDANNRAVKTAAKNALDYLAAKFTFQSFRGKRLAPARRNWDYRDKLGYYQNDYVPHLWGMLSGSYLFDDATGIKDYPEPAPDVGRFPYYFSNLGQAAGFALRAALSRYRIPVPIHDFMLNRRKGWEAWMQTRYTDYHYPIYYAIQIAGQPEVPLDDAYPLYFYEGSNLLPGNFHPVPQTYFVSPKYMNGAGGLYRPYYPPAIPGLELGPVQEALRAYDAYARPNSIVSPFDDGYWEDGIDSMENTTAVMRGLTEEFWKSGNAGSYKSFTYGYAAGEDLAEDEWPQRIPQTWSPYLSSEFEIGSASFRIYDFTRTCRHMLKRHYMVLAKMTAPGETSILRGFWEIVPRRRAAHAEKLKNLILRTNPSSHFPSTGSQGYKYLMASTGEKLALSGSLGEPGLCQGILNAWTDATETTEVPQLRIWLVGCDDEALKSRPLISVLQIDANYRFTGIEYAVSDGDGLVVVNNPHLRRGGRRLIIDSRDYRNPSNELLHGAGR